MILTCRTIDFCIDYIFPITLNIKSVWVDSWVVINLAWEKIESDGKTPLRVNKHH